MAVFVSVHDYKTLLNIETELNIVCSLQMELRHNVDKK